MSFLTPLYVLGALAIAGPILFHLIQRRPKGETSFSSLMFLSPSPPRLTRRSRLDNLLLLLLRALALTLLAIAFARPFLRSALQLGFHSIERRTVVLLDASASMRRDGVWQKALKVVEQICDDSSPADKLALMTFHESAECVTGFDEVSAVKGAHHAELVKQAAKSLNPSWHATDLGGALISACDLLQDAMANDTQFTAPPQIVVISDSQMGANIRSLDAFDWPEEIPVDVRTVLPDATGNAFVSVVESEHEELSEEILVRIENVDVSPSDEFVLQWTTENGEIESRRTTQVPPAQSRVIAFARDSMTERLVLRGDHEDFDNTVYFANPIPVTRTIWFVGNRSESEDPSQDLFYFLNRIDLSNRLRQVSIERHALELLPTLSVDLTPFVVVASDLTPAAAQILHAYMKSGGSVLAVFSKQEIDDATLLAWRTLTGLDALTISEAEVDRYAMLSDINFEHPFFAPFAESQFNDFTKVRFWAYRNLSPSHEHAWDILARFDNRSPALIERQIPESDGQLWILTSGWNTDDSQLALSSKFVPLIASMFNASDSIRDTNERYSVGDSITLASKSDAEISHIQTSDGRTVEPDADRFVPDSPGLYALVQNADLTRFAVNLDMRESLTTPMDLSVLEQRGVQLGRRQSAVEISEHQRQMKDVELESNQQLWRFLIFAAIVILGIETWLAGRYSTANTQERSDG